MTPAEGEGERLAQNIQARRHSAIVGRTVRHQGYGRSSNARRRRIEQVVGWIYLATGLRQFKARSRTRVGAVVRLHGMSCNLIHLASLLARGRRCMNQEWMAIRVEWLSSYGGLETSAIAFGWTAISVAT